MEGGSRMRAAVSDETKAFMDSLLIREEELNAERTLGVREVARIYDMTRTPMERYEKRIADINRLMEIGALKDLNLADRAREQAKAELGPTAFDKLTDEIFGREADRVKNLAERMWDDTRTPMEQYQFRLDDINQLLRLGAIDADTAARAQAQAQTTLQGVGAQGPRFGAAMERGSAAAFSTIINAQANSAQKIPKQQLTVAKQSLSAQKEIIRKLDPQVVSIPAT